MADVVQTATTAAGIITEIESLQAGASYYDVPTRTPEGDAAFVEALRMAEHPITRENLLRLVRELHIVGALEPAMALLAADDDDEVRGEAADTVGGLASFPLIPVWEIQRRAAREALLERWDVESDDMVRSCLAYSLVALAEPGMRPLFEACLTDRDDRVRRLGRTGLGVLDFADSKNQARRDGTALEGAAGRYDFGELAQIIHRHCSEADPYGLDRHPRRRHIHRVLEYGFRQRVDGEHTVIIRGRYFDLILQEDEPLSWIARVTDPRGISPCRRVADHQHEVLLRPLSLDTDDAWLDEIATDHSAPSRPADS